jgi:sugar phosphate permease
VTARGGAPPGPGAGTRDEPAGAPPARRPAPAADLPRYRWVILATGALGAGAFAALRMGLPALGPAIREEYGLTLAQVGLAFAAVAGGVMLTLVPWGVLSDRIGERPVMVAGLTGTAAALVAAAFAPTFAALLAGLLAAGMLGASATGASGRAVMGWFARSERGFALGIRQMALPLGGAVASLSLPLLAGAGGLQAAMLSLAGLSLVAALAAGALMRDAPPPASKIAPPPEAPPPVRDGRLWRLGAAGALLVVGQSAVLGFLVLFLHDARGVAVATAAGALAVVQMLGAAARLVAGRRSDREGLRIAPMRRIAARNGALFALVAVLAAGPGVLLYPVLLAAAVSAMTWNGLAFTAAAEISGRARAGTAMSLQNTVLSVGGAVAPTAFGALVGLTSWAAGFAVVALAPLAAFAVLAPLEDDEDERIADRERRLARARLAEA